jgi:hypothetical protein
MFSIPNSKILDKNAILAKDRAVQRQIDINLQKKFDPISKAMFREKQQELYPNILQVSNQPSLADLIANEQDSVLQNDPLQSYLLAKNNLLTIADLQTSDYILDRLNDDDINTLNQSFPKFIQMLSTKYKNIDKNKFIELIKSSTVEIPNYELSNRGNIRMNQKSDSEIVPNEMEQNQEYQYEDKSVVTPRKNPQKNITSPYLSKTVFGRILNENGGKVKQSKGKLKQQNKNEGT